MLEDEAYPFTTRMREDSRSVGRFETTQGGVLVAVGVGSGLTGRGGALIMADDLVKGPTEADSEATRASTSTWWQEVLMTRQMPNAAMLPIGTRWREDDVMGTALEAGSDSWTKIVLPFEAEEDDALGRERGALLWPARFWNALYQGGPSAAEGNLFKREWFANRYTAMQTEQPRIISRTGAMVARRVTVTALDAASKTGALNGFSVFVTAMTDGVNVYILDV